MTTSDSESLHSRADALTGLVCSFETRGTGVWNWQSPVCKAAGPPLLCKLQLCERPQARTQSDNFTLTGHLSSCTTLCGSSGAQRPGLRTLQRKMAPVRPRFSL